MPLTLARLRADAIRRTFFAPTTLPAALQKLGFVQADPIRSPARAQDLILRHRVKAYRAGDLEARYENLGIEEDFLYAYGFLPRANFELLHPRSKPDLTTFEAQVLNAVIRIGQTHPRELEQELGRERAVNAWGGYSKATTKTLQSLHYRGYLRIAKREAGIRIFEAAPTREQTLSPEARVRRLSLLIARVLAPAPVRGLLGALTLLRYSLRGPKVPNSIVKDLLASGELEGDRVEGVHYVWPAGKIIANEPPRIVRILAPFDPLVWDRRRFEYIFGWSYRFEAYTPEPRRVRGYYAMPLLWADQMVGWATASIRSQFDIKIGYIAKRPVENAFRAALDEEIDRFRWFLGR